MASSSADFFSRVSAMCGEASSGAATNSIDSAAKIQKKCNDIAQSRYPAETICPVSHQGFCSYSLLVGDSKVLQFRLTTDSLDMDIIKQAIKVHADLVPKSESLGTIQMFDEGPASPATMNLYVQDRISGVSLAQYRLACQKRPLEQQHADRKTLVRQFARFVARGCDQRTYHRPPTLGRVGSSLRHRLETLRDGLPERFLPMVTSSLDWLHESQSTMPWVLTHGDVVPGNIMVDPDGPRISGMLDWAEAEWLPMGIQLYGLEEFLGESMGGHLSTQYPPPMSVFRYFDDVQRLREAFWEEIYLSWTGPPMANLCETMSKCRVIGVLLWHGIAWDGGKLNRVVQEGIDDEEIQRLDLFLLGREALSGDAANPEKKNATKDAKTTVMKESENSMLDDILLVLDDAKAERIRHENPSKQTALLGGRFRVGQASSANGDGRAKKPGFGRRLLDFVTCRGEL